MKIWNYIVIMLTMMLVLTFLGQVTGFDFIFNIIGFDYNLLTGEILEVSLSASIMYTSLLLILATAYVAGIAIGFITKSKVENLLLAPFLVGSVALFIGTFGTVMNTAIDGAYPAWISAVLIVVLLPLSVGFVISLAEWFRGTD